jgi:hypothetical protein
MHDSIAARIDEYDREIIRYLAQMTPPDRRDASAPPPARPTKASTMKARGEEPLRQALFRLTGVDLTTIDAVGVETAAVVLSEYGPDLSRFPTEKQFLSHIRLAPHKPTSGGKPLRRKLTSPRLRRSRLRMAALSLSWRSAAALPARLLSRRRRRRLRHSTQTRTIIHWLFCGANRISTRRRRMTGGHRLARRPRRPPAPAFRRSSVKREHNQAFSSQNKSQTSAPGLHAGRADHRAASRPRGQLSAAKCHPDASLTTLDQGRPRASTKLSTP